MPRPLVRLDTSNEKPQMLPAALNTNVLAPLSCVVFLADTLEPGRGDSPELVSLRDLSRQDLYLAVAQTSTYVIQRLLAARRLIHPRTVLTRNWALQQTT